MPKYGLAVTGLADPSRLMTIDRAAPGDQLILTKAIGTGVVATALKHGQAPEDVIEAAVASMTLLNAGASQAALAAGVRAATDVTGFGLLGHLHRMLAASKTAARLYASAVPLLPGAAELAAAGFVSGGTRANTERMRGFAAVDPAVRARTGRAPARRADLRRPAPGRAARGGGRPARRVAGARAARRAHRRGRGRRERSRRRGPGPFGINPRIR